MKNDIVTGKNTTIPYSGLELSPMKCICCGDEIALLHPDFEDNSEPREPSSYMWNGGVVEQIKAGYGSGHDGDVFYIAVCDKCISQKIANGSAIFTYNYMGNFDTKERRKELNKILHRRNKLRRIIK